MTPAITRGGLPSAFAIVSATLHAASPWAESFGASIATVAEAEVSLPDAVMRDGAPRRSVPSLVIYRLMVPDGKRVR
jgi:hypothetical protein